MTIRALRPTPLDPELLQIPLGGKNAIRPTVAPSAPSPTFAAPVMAEPIAALPHDDLAAVRVQRPTPLSQADTAAIICSSSKRA